MEGLGIRIKEIRQDKGLTQYDIEKRTGIKREYYCKIEIGDLPNPTIGTLLKIARALNMPVQEIIPSDKGTPGNTPLTPAEVCSMKARSYLNGARDMRKALFEATKREYECLKAHHEKRLSKA